MIIERHLGLMPSNESKESASRIQMLGEAIENQVDLDMLISITRMEPIKAPENATASILHTADKVKIGIARDRAFGFYYPDDLDALVAAGAENSAFRHSA